MKFTPVYQSFNLDQKPYKLHSHDQTCGEGTIWEKNHAHQGMEFIYVRQGGGLIVIEQQIIPVKPGTLMYFQPFQMHHMKIFASEAGCYIRSKILFEPEIFYPLFQHLPLLQKFFIMLWKGRLTTQVMDFSHQKKELDQLFEQYKPMKNISEEEQQERFSVLLICFLQLIQDSWQQVETAPPGAPRTLNHAEKAFQWIETNFSEPFDLGKMADALYLSPQHISRLFRNMTGSTISEYLLSRRLKEACLFICTTELSIQEIAMHVGIPNVSRFCQVFKQKIGMTPLQYRVANNKRRRM